MDFEEFLPEEEPEDKIEEKEEKTEKISPSQIYEVITSRKPDWQAIIYDLISSEQLDPWDIDLVVLTKRYFEKIMELEGQDFYISSKVLLAAALLLRIKSEFLLNKHIKSIDEILFGKKDDKKYVLEKIEINEDELPLLIPKTPLPRLKRVTLPELMAALNKAMSTETRRINKEVAVKNAKKLSEVDFPEFKRIDLKERIKNFYAKVITSVKKIAVKPERHLNKIGYSNLVGKEREERLTFFLPLLHLSNTKKLWIEQERHLDEIWIYLYEYFDKNRGQFQEQFIQELEEDIEEMKEELAEMQNEEGDNKIEKMKSTREEKRNLEEEARKELEKELNIKINNEILDIEKQEKIEDISGFSDE